MEKSGIIITWISNKWKWGVEGEVFSMEKCNILGVEVNVTNMKETVNYIKNNLSEIKGNYVCIANVHTTIMAYENEEYRSIQNGGILTLPDGKPLSIVSRKRGYNNAERVTGPDLMEELFKISEENGYSHYFYGCNDETLKKLSENIKKKYPNICIKGMYAPPYKEDFTENDMDIINEINSLNVDFLWVGLGAPKQEKWMNYNKGKINSLMFGVGAAFDFYAGNIKRCPLWMQKLSLEWFYRLLQDPKRLFKRYLVTNSKFLYLILSRSEHISGKTISN